MGKTILETDMDGLNTVRRIPESPPVRHKTHMSTRPFPTSQLRISPPYGGEHEYIPEEDDENLNL